ncbi:MAG: lipid IV(A) 3-deoxy-D-manno-octulosonic acid transferase [Betaproteobacteria bacterium]|nr:lipid IV(A) 3-deoxy-D-manno-octulosonic acid transferase [Betaproteobacteria bacterium]
MIARGLYTLALWLALPLICVRLWLRGRREPGYRRAVAERFGRHAAARGAAAGRPLIWVHAVSVGEVRASIPLVRALQALYPQCEFLLTCMTAAGRDALDQVYGDSVRKAWLPYDYPFAVSGFLETFRPRLGVLIETEVWINLLAACRARNIPVLLASARMSARSARGYARLAALTRPAFERLASVCAQSEVDATRIASLGAHRVNVAGNLKFDVQPDPALAAAGAAFKAQLGGRPVLLLASTREGEERLLLEALAPRLPPEALLVVVPRHPQRFDEVAGLIAAAGMSVARRSLKESPQRVRVLLGDTMGEMAFHYAVADVVVIGGSLLPLGGQNLIEACAQGVPVVIGPHTFNFGQATQAAVAAGAAIQVEDANGAADVASRLLLEPDRRAAMSRAGLELCATHRGATLRHLEAIKPLLKL